MPCWGSSSAGCLRSPVPRRRSARWPYQLPLQPQAGQRRLAARGWLQRRVAPEPPHPRHRPCHPTTPPCHPRCASATPGQATHQPLRRIVAVHWQDPRSRRIWVGHPCRPGIRPGLEVSSKATAVNVSVTAVGPDSNGFLVVWPDGAPRPLGPSLNVRTGETTSSLVQVALGDHGALAVFNSAGTTDVIIDVEGYFRPGSQRVSGDSSPALPAPARIAGTRCEVDAIAVTWAPVPRPAQPQTPPRQCADIPPIARIPGRPRHGQVTTAARHREHLCRSTNVIGVQFVVATRWIDVKGMARRLPGAPRPHARCLPRPHAPATVASPDLAFGDGGDTLARKGET